MQNGSVPRAGDLPGGFASGESASNNVDFPLRNSASFASLREPKPAETPIIA